MSWNCNLDGTFDRLDTNIFDKHMFETFAEISLNVRLCYRVVEFTHDYFKAAEHHQMERLVNYIVYVYHIYPW